MFLLFTVHVHLMYRAHNIVYDNMYEESGGGYIYTSGKTCQVL